MTTRLSKAGLAERLANLAAVEHLEVGEAMKQDAPPDPAIEALDEEIASLNAEIDERARRQETDVTDTQQAVGGARDACSQGPGAQAARGGG